MAIVTISRPTFSGAKAVAEALSEKLGYPCISKEVIFDAAEEFGVSEQDLIATFEKSARSWNQTPHKRINHLSYVRFALLQRIENHNMVYHGYAGHLLMGELAHLIRVRVIDSIEDRIHRAVERNQLTRDEAVATIEKQDQQNRKWVKFLYDVDWEHPSLYDLVINLEHVDADGAVELLVNLTQLEAFQPTEASKKAFDNQLLSSKVWAALTKDPRTEHSYVRISADDGVVTIIGTLDSDSVLKDVRSIVMKVEGVARVEFAIGDNPDQLV